LLRVIIIKRTVIGLFTGLVGGAIFGAAVSVGIGLPTYFAGHSFFEKLQQLVLFAGFVGAVAGLIAGGIIGLIVGVFGLRKLYGALTGVVVILILAVYLVGPPASFHEGHVRVTILSALSAAALGALVAWFQGRKTNTPGPSAEL
jgi:hypothetical protein